MHDVCGDEDKPAKMREVTYFMKYIAQSRMHVDAFIYIYVYACMYEYPYISGGNATESDTRVQNFGGINRLREKVNVFSGWIRAGNGTCAILSSVVRNFSDISADLYACARVSRTRNRCIIQALREIAS